MLKELVQTESPSAAEHNCGGCGASIKDRSVHANHSEIEIELELNTNFLLQILFIGRRSIVARGMLEMFAVLATTRHRTQLFFTRWEYLLQRGLLQVMSRTTSSPIFLYFLFRSLLSPLNTQTNRMRLRTVNTAARIRITNRVGKGNERH